MQTFEMPVRHRTNSRSRAYRRPQQMKDASSILASAAAGDPTAASELLPLVYDELRRLAQHKMAQERAGHSLSATALVHEAYMRLVGDASDQTWDSRGHFFSAAAEAMRRILVENARRKARQKHGGGRNRVELEACNVALATKPEQLLAVDEALERLQYEDELAARIVKLRFFTGLSIEEAAAAVDVSRASAYRYWSFARAWLQCEVEQGSKPGRPE